MPNPSRKEQLMDMLNDMPDDYELRYMLAMEHSSEGDDEAAVRCFQEIFQMAPDYPPAYHMAGRALLRLDKPAEARAVLQTGIAAANKVGNGHAAGEMMELLESIED